MEKKALAATVIVLAAGIAGGGQLRPKDDGRPLANRDTGLVMHWYDNSLDKYGAKLPAGDDLSWFPGCRVVYFRLPWCELEPEEGVFDWALVDALAQRWIDRGGQIAFRITCSEPHYEYATPKWVFDAGAKSVRYKYGWGDAGGPRADGPSVDPVYDDPVFLSKLDKFLQLFAARYDGNPNVAFLDIGTYGTWGEGHSGGASHPPVGRTEIVIREHVDLHLKHFKRTQLVISDDISARLEPQMSDLLRYCKSKGVAWRDDSILVETAPREWYHALQADAYWRELPVVIESEHVQFSKAAGAWSGKRLADSVEEHHASYLSIHGDPHAILDENRAWIDRINARLGYRYRVEEVNWPDRIAADAKFFTVTWTWANAGVAPSYCDVYPTLTLKDAAGRLAAVWPCEKLNLRALPVGPAEKVPSVSGWFDVFLGKSKWRLKPGIYTLFVSAGLRDGTPKVELPFDRSLDDGHRRYRLGNMEVK